MTKKEVKEYLNNYKKSNMIYDRSSDYYDTFKDSDVLITDFSSIIVEYLMYNKPIIFCHRDMNILSDFMKEISKVCYCVNNWEEAEDVLKKLKNGDDALKSARTDFIDKKFENYDGKIKYRIIESIKNDYYK